MIFIVDDRADYRFLLQQVFTRFIPQYAVRFFPSGDALNQYIQIEANAMVSTLPGLILLDLNMPGLSGYQTLTTLKQIPAWKRVPVVMMSDLGTAQEQEQCYEAGANSFITKAMGLDAMKQAMLTICHYWLEINRPPVCMV